MSRAAYALFSVALTIALTVVHHLYGAWRYATPWRHHVAIVVLPVFALLLVAFAVQRLRPGSNAGRAALVVFAAIGGLVAVGWIGLFEGGYAHLVKNALYFAGMDGATFAALFPPPTYEVPDDAIFETTGVAQLLCGLVTASCLRRYWIAERTRV
jgi:FtsH-binding integral membrane protein